ncbi:hypothetical protein [Streptomyces sp. ISL-100]|uniref:DUF6907 domain-containing protein n=1 Tax=Streptomyces sp. ISL-100 TaxID=2819173 RepID=UPI001BEB95A5|nr:hypothetical protein [Streptomyces sp. ISL-100]MBT2399378.1 hypothetical protein [Streptomyces sp. ISL-100]
MKNTPTAASNGGPESHTTQPLGSACQAARLQSVPAAPSDGEPAVGGSAVRRTFTFTSAVTGEKVTATCMPGCTVDHEADSNTPEHPHDIYCNIPGTAGELPLYGPLCDTGSPENFRFLSWQIESCPFSARPAERLPFVAIEAIDDHYIEYLDPDTLEMVISRLQKRVDSLREAHAQLANVRTAYLNPSEVAA